MSYYEVRCVEDEDGWTATVKPDPGGTKHPPKAPTASTIPAILTMHLIKMNLLLHAAWARYMGALSHPAPVGVDGRRLVPPHRPFLQDFWP